MTSRIDVLLQNAVASATVPHVVAVLADRDGIRYEGSAGPRRVGAADPVGADTVFWIASMTKMVTTVAALQCRDAGLLDFDAPVAKYLPQFDDLQVLAGFDGDTPRLRAQASTARVAALVNHTSGASYWFWNADMVRFEELTGQLNVVSGLRSALSAPLVADPGARSEYGTSTDFLGLVVEAVSGLALDEYFAERITGPLGMADTGFRVRADQRARLAELHVPDPAGGWAPSGFELPAAPEYWTGGHGLYSTPRDYLAFQRMLLGGGSLDGVRLLAAETVAECFANQIGALDVAARTPTASPAHSADWAPGAGRKWGWGLLVNTADQPGARAAGSGAWAGLGNTHFWVDPVCGLTGAIYAQHFPFLHEPFMDVYAQFEREAYALVRS